MQNYPRDREGSVQELLTVEQIRKREVFGGWAVVWDRNGGIFTGGERRDKARRPDFSIQHVG